MEILTTDSRDFSAVISNQKCLVDHGKPINSVIMVKNVHQEQ